MKKAMIVGLVAVMILGLPAVAMAGKGNGMRRDKGLDTGEQEGGVVNQFQHGNTLKHMHKLLGDGKALQAKSQGAIHCSLVIDYNVPGGAEASGTATLTASRGASVETFEAPIPWGLSNDEALALLVETFGPMVQEAFGIEVRSFRLTGYSLDEEAAVVTATFVATHGEAPVKIDLLEDEQEGVEEDEVGDSAGDEDEDEDEDQDDALDDDVEDDSSDDDETESTINL